MKAVIDDSFLAESSSACFPENPPFVIEEACGRIPPIWPLKDFVAVNPFVGLSDRHFLQAAALLRHTAHGDILMPKHYYLERLDSGEITDEDIREAIDFARVTIPPPWSAFLKPYDVASLREELLSHDQLSQKGATLTVADAVDQSRGTKWSPFITDEMSKWCSVYFDEGQSSWRMPWRDQSLYQAWMAAVRHDANPRLSGLARFDEMVSELPRTPVQAIEEALNTLGIPIGLQADFLHRQLFTIAGWSAYVQYRVRQDKMRNRINPSLIELLAVRLAYDCALWKQFRSQNNFAEIWAEKVRAMQQFQPELDLLPRFLVLAATEKSYQRQLAKKLFSSLDGRRTNPSRPSVQAVFCIDVRSERFRRHLEAQDDKIITSGFAGFFGMPIEYIPLGRRHGVAQCPVLFLPKYKVREGLRKGDEQALDAFLRQKLFGQRVSHAWNAFKTSAISCFSFVETAGLWFGYRLCRDALAWGHDSGQHLGGGTGPRLEAQHGHAHELSPGIPLSDQVNLAEGALRNLGLTRHFPRLVLFCGHGGASANNPYASGLDCGACGGHAGQVNAQVAAQILNQAAVREALELRGIQIPQDTFFLAGLHNTTTDEVKIVEADGVPASHLADLDRLAGWLRQASVGTRSERAQSLGLTPNDRRLANKINTRSRDWAQVRPEWGLANNAALIAAPRERTRGVNLEGRTFLHDYDAESDPEGKVLELILTAPVVVANWINLQYFASTVNNPLFGSGKKTIHNVVGTLGVWQGNGGDLQVGLPLQSLHNGDKWMHEPLRLSVFIESSREAIDGVLAAHLEVRELVQNGWLSLFAMQPKSGELWQYSANFQWQKIDLSIASKPDLMISPVLKL